MYLCSQKNMGLRYDSEERPKLAEALGLTIVELEDGTLHTLGDELFTPSDVAAQILKFSYDLVTDQFGVVPGSCHHCSSIFQSRSAKGNKESC